MSQSKMSPWPPSPFVEDEATALLHEHSLDASSEVLKSDNQATLNRGSVDQCPVIVDPKQEEKQHIKNDSIAYDSAYSSGPATPPPPMVRGKGRSKSDESLSTCNTQPRIAANDSLHPSPPEARPSTHSRPQAIRIQTDLGSGLSSYADGTRREPSPYSNQGVTPKSRQNSAIKPPEILMSPGRVVDSPVAFHKQSRYLPLSHDSSGFERPNAAATDRRPPGQGHDNSTSNIGRIGPRPRVEGLEDHRSPQLDARRAFNSTDNYSHQYTHEQHERRAVNGPMSPPHSRRESRDSTFDPTAENSIRDSRHSSGKKSIRDARESPYTSSAEDSTREHRRRQERDAGADRKRSRRRSSHRKERQELANLAEPTRSLAMPNSAFDGSSYYRRDSRPRGRPDPITPLTADPTKLTDDYFERAFRDNLTRKSQGLQGYHSSGSVLVSPMTSRPSTPRSERHSRDYFETSSSAQHSTVQSHRPSVDAGQIREARVHGNIPSNNTSGVTKVDRASNHSSKSPTQSAETFLTPSTTKAPSTTISRRTSFARDEARPPIRNASYSHLEASHSMRDSLAPTQDSSRATLHAGANDTEYTAPSHTHRAMSYSGSEQHTSWNGQSMPSGLGLRNVSNLNAFGSAATMSHDHGAKTPTNGSKTPMNGAKTPTNSHQATLSSAKALFASPCPRSKPSVGQNDWYTIKGLADLDICPTCIRSVWNTRYQHLFVPSLPRPYKQPSVCALSKPWAQVAFVQSLNQKRPDLAYIREVASLPPQVTECAGHKMSTRRWNGIIDPSTKDPVPDFLICTACAHRIDKVFPNLHRVFDRPNSCLARERVCSMHDTSQHFNSVIDRLEQAHNRCDGYEWRYTDIEGLVRYLRRLTRYEPCRRDVMLASKSWHFMANLPEFTVCEECYDEVVWPLRDWSIARDICKISKPVSSKRNAGSDKPVSCQLYSQRMRDIFRDAVAQRDFHKLEDAARIRIGLHQRLLEQNKSYEVDQHHYKIDRRAEIEHNREIWRQNE